MPTFDERLQVYETGDFKAVKTPMKGEGGNPFGCPRRAPKAYHKIVVKRKHLTATDFNVGEHYNETNLSGLENGIPNCYTNACLHVCRWRGACSV